METPVTPTKTCIVVAGPTASGKSDIAVQVAQYFQTAVISADSRQCYRELRIGVARPPESLLQQVPHYFIADRSIHEPVTAAGFEMFALEKAADLFKDNDFIVLAGGTGLYIKAFCEGLDAVAPPDPKLRESLQQQYDAQGFDWLKKTVESADPLFALHGEMQNPRRMLRALEVMHTTGHSILEMHAGTPKPRPFNILSVCLDMPRPKLYQRINQRVLQMVEEGLEEEARALYPYKHLNALQTVGYKEWFEYFEGQYTREETIERVAKHTRHYAKRQITWFKKQQGMHFVEASFPAVIQTIIQKLKI